MKKHFVTFYSPGTFVNEQTTKEVDSWDIDKAVEMSKTIKERYGAIPYAFQFHTKEQIDGEWGIKETDKSNFYFINCEIKTLEDIENENDPENRILISNMKSNGWGKVAQTIKGWKYTIPFEENDILLGG